MFQCFAKGLRDGAKKNTVAIMGMQTQQTLLAFASGSAHFDSEIPRMQGPYLKIDMKNVKWIENME